MISSKPRMVFLDAGTVDYGDLSLKPLQDLGRLRVYHHTKPQTMAARLKNTEIAITNKCVLSRPLLKSLPQLRCIALTATGTNNIDLKAARDLGIAVCNVPGYSTDTVAQNTIALMLALAGNILKYDKAARHGAWSRSPFFVCGAYPILELKGKKLGILGFGAIGKRVAQIARSLGMKVVAGRIPGRQYSKKEAANRVAFDRLIRESDIVTIHTPLTALTEDLIDGAVLRKMKRSAFLINMARGGIVNEGALAGALRSGRIAGAASDVLTQEPPPRNHVLLKARNFILMPHVSWASREVRVRLIDEVTSNIQAFLKGRKRHRMD